MNKELQRESTRNFFCQATSFSLSICKSYGLSVTIILLSSAVSMDKLYFLPLSLKYYFSSLFQALSCRVDFLNFLSQYFVNVTH